MTGAVTVRFFAAAAEAAGCDHAFAEPGTGQALRAELADRFGQGLAHVLHQSALVAGGARIEDADRVAPGARVDVLPPFAGG